MTKGIYGSYDVHGMSRTSTYRIWTSMKSRCRNENNQTYAEYGGRGITVCERWDKFMNFLSDMGVRPDGHSLDRINNDAGYSPDNCRWATRAEQNRNTRLTVNIEFNGVKKCITDWAIDAGMTCYALKKSIASVGVEEALKHTLIKGKHGIRK